MFDVIIIGGGPGGIYSAIIASLLGMKSCILEKTLVLGGQPIQLYPKKKIYDFPGFEEVVTKDIFSVLHKQLDNLENQQQYYTNIDIKTISKENNNSFIIDTNQGQFKANYIIFAIGDGIFQPKKLIIDQQEINLENVHYYFQENKYLNKKIIILGGGDAALDWANYLIEKKITDDVIVVHRRNEYRANDSKVNKIIKNKIKQKLNYTIIKINNNELIMKNNENNEEEKIIFDYIVVQYGPEKIMHTIKFLNNSEPSYNNLGKFFIDINCKTNIEGIYAIGNATTYNAKPNLIINSMADGARAIYHIRNDKKTKNKINN